MIILSSCQRSARKPHCPNIHHPAATHTHIHHGMIRVFHVVTLSFLFVVLINPFYMPRSIRIHNFHPLPGTNSSYHELPSLKIPSFLSSAITFSYRNFSCRCRKPVCDGFDESSHRTAVSGKYAAYNYFRISLLLRRHHILYTTILT